MTQTKSGQPPRRLTYTCQEVGDILGVHQETIRRRAHKGEIPFHRVGDRWLIPSQWVRDVLEGNATIWQPNDHGQLTRQVPGGHQ